MAALYSLTITIKILLWLLSVCVNWPPTLILGSHTPSRTTTQQTNRDGPCCSPKLSHPLLLITKQGQSLQLKHKCYTCCEKNVKRYTSTHQVNFCCANITVHCFVLFVLLLFRQAHLFPFYVLELLGVLRFMFCADKIQNRKVTKDLTQKDRRYTNICSSHLHFCAFVWSSYIFLTSLLKLFNTFVFCNLITYQVCYRHF